MGVKPKHFFALSDVLFEPTEAPQEKSKAMSPEEKAKWEEELLLLSPEERPPASTRYSGTTTWW